MWAAALGAPLALLFAVSGIAADQDPAHEAIQKKLESEYQLTKTTDDKSDIVTAGSVLVLHKDKVTMVAATSATNPCMNTYKDGKIVQSKTCGANETAQKAKKWGSMIPGLSSLGSTPSASSRNFVSGEKFWLTKIDVRSNGIILYFFTDAINDTRYIGALTIPFGSVTPAPDEALKAVAEVITVAPADDSANSGGGDQQQQPAPPQGGRQQKSAPPPQQAAAPPPQPAAAPPPLDIPPPPPADPVEIKIGQTPDQVVAALGQPLRKAKTATKEIYFYKDLKVTFVNGKVKDVE
jgi:hypothetical protein